MALLLKDAKSEAGPDLAECFPLGYIVVSSDKDTAHLRFHKAQPPKTVIVVPTHSPDIHKVVEHPLHPFKKQWYPEFAADASCNKVTPSMALASEILHRYKNTSVENDLKTLPATLQAIIDNRGDWAPAHLC